MQRHGERGPPSVLWSEKFTNGSYILMALSGRKRKFDGLILNKGQRKVWNFFHVWIHLSTDLMVGQIRILHSYLKSILKYRLWENWTILYYFSRSPKVWETQVRIRDILKQSSDIQRPGIKSHEMVFWEWEAYFFSSFNFRL